MITIAHNEPMAQVSYVMCHSRQVDLLRMTCTDNETELRKGKKDKQSLLFYLKYIASYEQLNNPIPSFKETYPVGII